MRKLILWDIDGTLLNCGSDGTEALNKTFKDMYGVEDAFLSAGIGSKMDYDIIRNIMESNDIYEKNFASRAPRVGLRARSWRPPPPHPDAPQEDRPSQHPRPRSTTSAR